jgi:hypothetical protein
LHKLLKKGLQATEGLFAQVRPLYACVHQVAHVLSNHEQQEAKEVKRCFTKQLVRIQELAEETREHREPLLHFLKVTRSYEPHLFFCYQISELPRTNNALEQAFGSVRAAERRATGRRGAFPAVVLRGPVRVTAALATRLRIFTAQELVLHDVPAWRALRAEISSRQEARRKQLRFRKDPTAYLADLERRLSEMSLRP